MENFILIDQHLLKELNAKMDLVIEFISKQKDSDKNGYIGNKELLLRLDICSRTAQRLRDEGKITFSKDGRKIRYKTSDVEAYINRYVHKAFKTDTSINHL